MKHEVVALQPKGWVVVMAAAFLKPRPWLHEFSRVGGSTSLVVALTP